MDRSEKELKVMIMLIEHGVSRDDAIVAVNEIWSERDLDEIISFPPEKVAELAQEMKDL